MIETDASDDIRVPAAEWEAMKARLAALERLVDERTPIAIEGQVTGTEGAGPANPPGQGRTNRRGLLKQGAVLAAGAVTGGVALVAAQAAPAAAATGTMQYGTANNAANAETTLTSTSIDATLGLANSNGLGLWVTSGGARIDETVASSGTAFTVNAATDGTGVDVEHTGSDGFALVASNRDSSNLKAAIFGETVGDAAGVLGFSEVGPGVMGTSTTGSPAVWGDTTGPSLYATAVRGTAAGYASGVVGASSLGNGTVRQQHERQRSQRDLHQRTRWPLLRRCRTDPTRRGLREYASELGSDR